MAEVGKLSASKITTYKGCSMAYFLKYINHEKVPTSVRMVFGKGIHYMLERFYDLNYKSSESFTGYWNYYWIEDVSGGFLKGKQKEKLKITEYFTGSGSIKVGNHVSLGKGDPVGVFFGYMKLGQDILRRFYQRHIIEKLENKKNRKPPIEKEMSFGVKKEEPFEINGHLVRGVFDRIDKTPKGFYITDYKTDKSSPGLDSFVLHRHPQFTLYSYAFKKIFNKKEKAILYYHLRSGKIFKTHRSEKDYDYLKKLLDEVSEGIDKEIFVPFYGFHCNFCDYKVACEKYSVPHHGGPRIDLEGKIKSAETYSDWDIEIPDWMEMQTEER